MPEISRFLGIIIRMYPAEHNPPHFHAIYGDHEALFSIEHLKKIKGRLPNRVKDLIIEWATLHQKELMSNWNKLREEQPIKKIKPLV